MKPVYVPHNPHEKEMQRALIQYRNPKNRELVKEALRKAGREDLIGFGPKCLLRPGGGTPAPEGKHKDGRKSQTGKISVGENRNGKAPVRGTKETVRPKKKTIRNTHRKKNS